MKKVSHKSKLFKKVFQTNADDITYDSQRIREGNIVSTGKKLQVMTQDTFVPLMGAMWSKAKARYKQRYKRKAIQFAKWVAKNYQRGEHKGKSVWFTNGRVEKVSTEELFKIWEKKK